MHEAASFKTSTFCWLVCTALSTANWITEKCVHAECQSILQAVTKLVVWNSFMHLTKKKHTSSVPAKKFKAMPSARKIVANVLWDHKGVLLVDMYERSDTVSAEHYCGTREMLTAGCSSQKTWFAAPRHHHFAL
jgi:hypothetical protein